MVKEETPNHALNKYDPGDDWDYNEDMDHIEERLVIRDTEANRSNYTPHDGALFIATDTGAEFDGDGSSWNKADREVQSLSTDEAFGAFADHGLSIFDGKLERERIADFGSVAGQSLARDTDRSLPDGTVDVFLTAGQSNAVGQGDATQSPDIPQGDAYEWDGGSLSQVTDPIGNANDGSAWPSFVQEYRARTGRTVVIVPYSVGGSSQTEAADDGPGNWTENGVHYGNAVDEVQNALAYLENNNYNPVFQGILWHQGEQDAMGLDEGQLGSVDTYVREFIDMIQRFRADLDAPRMPFYTFQIGHDNAGDTTGFQEVRHAQMSVGSVLPNTYMVFEEARNYPERGLMLDSLHYNQTGLNEMGATGARTVADVLEKRVRIQPKRGPTSEVASYTGAKGEIAVNTDFQKPVVHDGRTQGGWGAPKSTSAFRSTGAGDQSIASSSDTFVVFDTTNRDELNAFNTGNGRFEVPYDGRYRISSAVTWTNFPSGARAQMRVVRNGNSIIADRSQASTTDDLTCSPAEREIDLVAGDVVGVKAFQSTGTSQLVKSGEPWTFLEIVPA